MQWYTALHCAAQGGFGGMCTWMISLAGVKADLKNTAGATAAQSASPQAAAAFRGVPAEPDEG